MERFDDTMRELLRPRPSMLRDVEDGMERERRRAIDRGDEKATARIERDLDATVELSGKFGVAVAAFLLVMVAIFAGIFLLVHLLGPHH